MAKLSARGRAELARVSKERTMPDIVKCSSCEGTGKYTRDVSFLNAPSLSHKKGDICNVCEGKGEKAPLTTWERHMLCFMSDRTILEKRDVRFQPDRYHPEGKLHSYGWKVRSKANEGVDVVRFIQLCEEKGYKRA